METHKDTMEKQNTEVTAQISEKKRMKRKQDTVNTQVKKSKVEEEEVRSVVLLPDYIRRNKAVMGLVTEAAHNSAYTDNLCLFRCLALHRGQSRYTLERTTNALFNEYTRNSDADTFAGVTLDELRHIEKKFKLNINVWELTQTDSGKPEINLHR